MKLPLRIVSLVLSGLVASPLAAQEAAAPPEKAKQSSASAAPAPSTDKLPMTGLAPSKLIPNLCLVKYRVTTTSSECQAFFDQGLGYFYSYVWMEAARSFETAARHDPNCPMAWWGLSRALERWGKGQPNKAMEKADALKDHASDREQMLILARMQEKGLAPNVGDSDARKRAAIKTLDTLLALYDDDEEGWYYRAQLAGGSGLFGGQVSSVPFYKSLLRINVLHPGANHELLHFYETMQRPALGWIYAENYIKSSPGIPHAFHMQAHLATRIGKWNKTTDRSARAIELERAYHKEMNVKPREDSQFVHHLETLTLSLIHDGRYREARVIRDEARGYAFRSPLTWFRLALAENDWDEATRIIGEYRKKDKVTASYLAAQLYLRQGDAGRATPEVQVLQEAYQRDRQNRQMEFRLWETLGQLLCLTGGADEGLKLLGKAVERSKTDYSHHAWGNGAYYMELWGIAALHAGRADVAEEAFLEALAHDPGSVRAALGLQILCERHGRSTEAEQYARLARRCWRHADVQTYYAELDSLRGPLTAQVPVAAESAALSAGQEISETKR
jgi:tetratricopeptide (TPR) repeat protein